MITGINSTTVFVTDQDRAVDFYVNKLGFEKRMDVSMGPEQPRWIEVVPPGGQTALTLYLPTREMPGADSLEEAQARTGIFTGITLGTDDIQKTYEELSAKGAEFRDPPAQQPWGWWATLVDPDGNSFGIYQSIGG
ncbi:MAG: hypothetical protein QOF51_2559 [Chloroflexota bacterium]|jgi:catechol 2,3-dioxygenase-like lactoylglutathione lyase family enzyme|nr:hypothetical protein [Chloroflexota bacterium]